MNEPILYVHSGSAGGAEIAAPLLASKVGMVVWHRGNSLIGAKARDFGIREVNLGVATDSRTSNWSRRLIAIGEILRINWELVSLLRKSRPTFLLSNSVQGLLHVAVPAFVARVPLIAYVRDLGEGGNRPAREVAVYRFLIQRFTRGAIFNSDLTRSSWSVSTKSTVSPTAVPDSYYEPVPRNTRSKDTVLMVGRISPWKGQAEVIRAMNTIGDAGLRLRLVGDSLFGEADELPPAVGATEFLGHIDDPAEEMRKATVLVHASTTPEPFGQVLAQAAATGLPIICANRGGHLEWLQDEVSCLVADPEDAQSFGAAIARLIVDDRLAENLADTGLDAAQMFRADVVYEDLRKWIQEIVKDDRGTN